MSRHEESICHNVTANPSSTCGHHILLSYGLWIIYQLKITLHWNKIILSTNVSKIIFYTEFFVLIKMLHSIERWYSTLRFQYITVIRRISLLQLTNGFDHNWIIGIGKFHPCQIQPTFWVLIILLYVRYQIITTIH